MEWKFFLEQAPSGGMTYLGWLMSGAMWTMPKAALVIGGVAEKPQIAGLRAGSPLVIATPGRLQDFTPEAYPGS